MSSFMSLLERRWQEDATFLCVGLDTDYSKLPPVMQTKDRMEAMLGFNKSMIDSTQPYACAFKINLGFYSQYAHIGGIEVLIETVKYLKGNYPLIPAIIDAKVGDIGKSNEAYAKTLFEAYGADAITVHPLLGQETMKPFEEYEGKGIIVLCHTSNPGASEFQHMLVKRKPLYLHIAEHVSRWNTKGNYCLVVGATYPKELAKVRKVVGDMALLVPGIGTQQGDLEASVKAGINSKGEGLMVNMSSGILYADHTVECFRVAGQVSRLNRDQMNFVLSK